MPGNNKSIEGLAFYSIDELVAELKNRTDILICASIQRIDGKCEHIFKFYSGDFDSCLGLNKILEDFILIDFRKRYAGEIDGKEEKGNNSTN